MFLFTQKLVVENKETKTPSVAIWIYNTFKTVKITLLTCVIEPCQNLFV